VDATATASLLVAVALGIESMSELHFPMDLAAGATTLLTLLRVADRKRESTGPGG